MDFFDFCSGNVYRYAVRIAKSVAEHPGRMYNPLVLYGPPGVGKTHLMTAMRRQLERVHKDLTVLFVSAEDFIKKLASDGKRRNGRTLAQACERSDVLLVDDLELLEGKEAIQAEFFCLLERCLKSGKQIVLCIGEGGTFCFSERIGKRLAHCTLLEMQLPDDKVKSDVLNLVSNELNVKPNERQKQYILRHTATAAQIKSVLEYVRIFCEKEKHPRGKTVEEACRFSNKAAGGQRRGLGFGAADRERRSNGENI